MCIFVLMFLQYISTFFLDFGEAEQLGIHHQFSNYE